MIRFVDATPWYWADVHEDNDPCCMFIDTVTDRCVAGATGDQVFFDLENIKAIPERGARCAGLVPDGFFTSPGPVAIS